MEIPPIEAHRKSELAHRTHKLHDRQLSKRNKAARLVWRCVWVLLFRPTPRWAHSWRRAILRLFGARLGRNTYIYPSVQIFAPWNLVMDDFSCLSHFVDCYNVDAVRVGYGATVSQYSYLCTATHDYNRETMPLMTAPIILERGCWLAADVFVGPGVVIGERSVALARSTIVKDVAPHLVVAGNPARVINTRVESTPRPPRQPAHEQIKEK